MYSFLVCSSGTIIYSRTAFPEIVSADSLLTIFCEKNSLPKCLAFGEGRGRAETWHNY
jgi:hypothetical protein